MIIIYYITYQQHFISLISVFVKRLAEFGSVQKPGFEQLHWCWQLHACMCVWGWIKFESHAHKPASVECRPAHQNERYYWSLLEPLALSAPFNWKSMCAGRSGLPVGFLDQVLLAHWCCMAGITLSSRYPKSGLHCGKGQEEKWGHCSISSKKKKAAV